MKRLASVLFWSVIAAAFIGPGTVTTAASAGAGHGLALLWALAFSTLACLVLQEAAARLTLLSGRSLAAALAEQYPGGWRRAVVFTLVLGAIVLGCAAYEAGNILGGVAGAALGTGLPKPLLTALSGLAAALILGLGAPRTVARLLSVFVAVMGVAFLVTAVGLAPDWGEVLRGTFVPALPVGSGLLVLGLVGTTVVPYNLFLGSGLARQAGSSGAAQGLGELRFGLAVAIVAGGLISMAIVVVGTAVAGPFSFEALGEVLAERLGPWGRSLFAYGLLAAGLSSAITAPLAAALTARGLFAGTGEGELWGDRSLRFRAVWLGVLATGVVFGLLEVRPVPVILLAQAFNGVLLPLVALFLLLAVNDRRLLGDAVNPPVANLLLALVVAVTIVLGVTHVARATAGALAIPLPGEAALLLIAAGLTLLLAVPVTREVLRRRRGA